MDALERRYNAAPGSSADWPLEAFVRAAEFYRIEANTSSSKKKQRSR